ncbi:outer membrane protein [Azospirillum sp. ST 5-10]|uniref:outer membrane protein n=1 Tax=unclassified Azospirillum TaxID=2630922 RepID=UPI003F4A7FA2
MGRLVWLLGLVGGLAGGLAVSGGAAAADGGVYLRADLSYDWSRSTRFHDWNCAGTDPRRVELFGCDARAAGDFGGTAGFGAGIGYRLSPLLRIEAALAYRPGWRFAGDANFPISGDQPVRADATTLTGLVNGYLDLAGLVPGGLGRFQPYVGGGVGVSRNRTDGMDMRFPVLDQRVTTPSGWHTSFAWQLTAGTGVALSESLTLDVAYRYTDFGRVMTEDGEAPRWRAGSLRVLDIDGTEARLRSHGVQVGLRYAF